MGTVRIAPSILAADFTRLATELESIERGGADWVHVDVMDGHFVPNITIGPFIVEAVKRATSLPLDVHLMIEEPERYVEDFVKAGAATVGVHVETCPHLHRSLAQIREAGARACAVLNPATPASAVEPVLADVDQQLLMTVNPGFGGQKFRSPSRRMAAAASRRSRAPQKPAPTSSSPAPPSSAPPTAPPPSPPYAAPQRTRPRSWGRRRSVKLAIPIVVALVGSWLLVLQLRRYRERTAETLLEDGLDLVAGHAPILPAALFLMAVGGALVYSHYAFP